ncbi:hypothetical protein PUV54_04025 [Hyphococcus flavus]|uniref:Uncharacterized protein n=1 Tax=Hyphococcus flavus TaxID=1866326 RepID=A0AAE9ZCQ6_9PROT|nr:hypothetical protein [Hyphococcus flavus]WDI32359.1 hypothetical protein PUV54_04025 [Hyphococcus flavus]
MPSKKEEKLPNFLISASIRKEETNRDGWSFSAPIRFNEDTITFKRFSLLSSGKPTITVGLSLVHLHFILDDCVLPEDGWAFDPPIQVERKLLREATKALKGSQERATSTKSSHGAEGELSPTTPKASIKTQAEAGKTEKAGSAEEHVVKDAYNEILHYVSAAGNDKDPRWTVRGPEGQCLNGVAFKNGPFAHAKIIGENPSIKIEADIPEYGLMISDDNHVFRTANKVAIGKILFKKKFLGRRFELTKADISKDEQSP